MVNSQRGRGVVVAEGGVVAEAENQKNPPKSDVPSGPPLDSGAEPASSKSRKRNPNNGDLGPDFFDGKTKGPQSVVPTTTVVDELLGADQSGGIQDDDDENPQGQKQVDKAPPKPVEPAGKVLGCPRCYFSKNGCSVCRRPGYTPRGLIWPQGCPK